MTDVLLTHSYHLPYDRKQVKKMQPYPPLGTLYAAAVLRSHGVSVAVFDPMLQEPLAGFREAVRVHGPKVVAIYEDDFNFLTKMCLTRMRDLAWQMAQQARRAGARVLVHGSDSTDHAGDYLRNGCDLVLKGESEYKLLEVVQALLGGRDVPASPEVLSSASPGMKCTGPPFARNPWRPTIDFPLPARDLIDMQRYRESWQSAHGRFSLNLVASRGCPYRCNWCAKPIFGDAYSSREPSAVADEMMILQRSYKAEHLWFADDIFALNPKWVEQFAREVESRDCAVPFKIQARADRLGASTATALKRAGCAEVWMGVESGSQKILDAMDKGLRVEEIVSARKELGKQGIRTCYFLQFGYPGEAWEDLRKTIELVRETKPDDIGISFSYPLPNTRFHEQVQSQLGEKRNWSDSEDLCVMFKGTYNDRFYRAVRDALHAEVETYKSPTPAVQDYWKEVDLLEPISRNRDATELPTPMRLSSRPLRHAPEAFVSIRDFTAAPGDR